MVAEVKVIPGKEWTRVANELRAIQATFPTQLRKELRDAAKPLVDEAKAEAKNLSTGNKGSTGLRKRVAAGVRAKAGVGENAYLRIVTSMQDSREAAIPRGFDMPRGWKHPVFGMRDTWVQQSGSTWFRETMARGQKPLEERLKKVMDEAVAKIAALGGRP